MDDLACNYNSTANTDDNSCLSPSGCDTCSGETDGSGTIVDNDNDDDSVCDLNELEGCTDETACNYDATPATMLKMIYVYILMVFVRLVQEKQMEQELLLIMMMILMAIVI